MMNRHHDRTYTVPPSLADIDALASKAFASIPQALRQHTGDVLFRIVDFCDEETCRDLDLESPFDLLGLYRGIGLTQKSVADIRQGPDVIELYRRPILDYWCESGEALFAVVRHVLIHEIGHHFGLSDLDMERIETINSE